MEYRDRASGWRHAKLSGHKNEELVKNLLDNNQQYATYFLEKIGVIKNCIAKTSIGGLHETNVPGILGNKTKSKTDLKIFLDNGSNINISIKKSLGGQVYFVGAKSFIEIFEKQFKKSIPNSVQTAMKLFWAADDNAINIIKQYADKNNEKNYLLQIRHKSLNADTLKAYNKFLYFDLLNWFIDNSYEITALCFSMGAAKYQEDWSKYIWYINLLGENDIDKVIAVSDICNAVQSNATNETYYSPTNGGTTIQLPFGFVQWHQGKLQFHHKFEKIINIL